MPLTALHLRAARARIAAVYLASPLSPELGSIRLREDQCASAARVAAALARHGGCLLADDVGRGKTYVALAVARSWARPLVVAPASLRSTWMDAMRRAGVDCALVSHESLSRGRLPPSFPDGIIVDESHRFRSTKARRYSALASLSARARLLLLSATPLQNGARDLAAQVALFHGARAFQLDAPALAAFVVRGAGGDPEGMPALATPTWVHPVADDAAVLEAILALPSPARPVDGGDVGVLRTIGLVRAWASSRAALVATLRRRRRVAAAMEQSAMHGLIPTKREIRSWLCVDGDIQLGLAPLLVAGAAGEARAAELLRAVSAEHEALSRLSAMMDSFPDPDEARVRALREIRLTHPGARVLAFSEHASTARAFYAGMRQDAGVGLLTAHDARIASGRVPREALLARFAPRARHAPAPLARECITLLIATDLLSEGANLQDASVVVHLDLPWNPARLAQRVGRARRPGGAPVVHAYLIAPPARAELLLDVETRLRRKLAQAARAIGTCIDVVPRLVSLSDHSVRSGWSATAIGEVAERIARWARRRSVFVRRAHPPAIIAGASGIGAGWLAALDDGRLVGRLEARPGEDIETVSRASQLCEGPSRPLRPGEGESGIAECQRWLDAEWLARDCGQVSGLRELDVAVERRLARAMSRAPRHERPSIAAHAKRLRDALGPPRPLGAERALRALLDRPDGDDDSRWLIEAADLARAAPALAGRPDRPRIVALIAWGAAPTDTRDGSRG